jgi:hypothetical protein
MGADDIQYGADAGEQPRRPLTATASAFLALLCSHTIIYFVNLLLAISGLRFCLA